MRLGLGFDLSLPRASGVGIDSDFLLTQPEAENVGFTVVDRGADSIRLIGTTARNHIAWLVSLPIGTRIRFDWATPLAAWARVTNEPTLQTGPDNNVLAVGSGIGSGFADHTLVAARSYFGFLTTNTTAALHIRNLRVDIP